MPQSRKMLGRPRMFTVGGIDVGNAWWSAADPEPCVGCTGPQLALLDAPTPRIEHRCRRLVGEQLGRLLQLLQEPRMHRPQRERGAAYPVRQGGAIERDALACIDLRFDDRAACDRHIWRSAHARPVSRWECRSRSAAPAPAPAPLRRRAWQAYLGRRVTITLNCAGITSSRSETSSPIRCLIPILSKSDSLGIPKSAAK
jgi:hypothetical protein